MINYLVMIYIYRSFTQIGREVTKNKGKCTIYLFTIFIKILFFLSLYL